MVPPPKTECTFHESAADDVFDAVVALLLPDVVEADASEGNILRNVLYDVSKDESAAIPRRALLAVLAVVGVVIVPFFALDAAAVDCVVVPAANAVRFLLRLSQKESSGDKLADSSDANTSRRGVTLATGAGRLTFVEEDDVVAAE